jgi:phospholipid/cholesterol/gamma-HCH transport system substrate-binding protein
MRLHRRVKLQLTLFAVVALVAGAIMVFGYINLPAMLFGAGRYTVTAQFPQAAGLYASGNVTYRGTEVGRVSNVELTDTGVNATLELKSDVVIPSNVTAQVHSASAIGEQYVSLTPLDATSPPLRGGDVIPMTRTAVPPDISNLLDATNTALQAIPNDNLRTVVDESYTAIGGLGPDLARFVKGSTQLAIDSQKNLDPLLNIIDNSAPILDSQAHNADAIAQFSHNIAEITAELRDQNSSVASTLDNGGPAADQVHQLLNRVQLTLPVLLANLVNIGQVAVTYQADIEQLLVLLPAGTADLGATTVANRNTKQSYKGWYLSFNLNLNLPPPCTTGYLPASQIRPPSMVDTPDRPTDDLYCRIPQDSKFNVRGARNIPCETKPWKRAPTVKICESDQDYVPLNDGLSWKGDPNATLSGQDIPQSAPVASVPPAPIGAPRDNAPPPIAAAEYDPATGTYVGPDGRVYTQANLARDASKEQTWQSMLLPPTGP